MNDEPNGWEVSAADGGELEPFLREAPGIIRGLQRNVERLAGDERDEALSTLALLCHRLYGAASLYGLTDIADLAAAMESAAESTATGTVHGDGHLEAARHVFTEAVSALDSALSAVGLPSEDARAPASSELLAALAALARAGNSADRDPLSARLRRQAASNPDVLEFFEPEAREHLDGIASALGDLASGCDPATVDRAFRLVHTLKGAALMVDCEPIGQLAHAMEDLLELARDRRLSLDGEPLAAFEQAYDLLLEMVAALRGRRTALTVLELEVRTRLAQITKAPGGRHPTEQGEAEPSPLVATPVEKTESEPVEVEGPETGAPDHAEPGDGPQRKIRVSLDRIDALGELVGEAMISRSRLEYLVEQLQEIERQYAVSRRRMAQTAEEFESRHFDLRLGDGGDRTVGGDDPGGGAGRGMDAARGQLDGFSELELDRYTELDVLMRQVAELSFDLGETQALLSGLSREMTVEIKRSSRLLRELRSSVGRTRMLSLARLLERFQRYAERSAVEADKQVRLEVSGGGAEVDAAIVERLADPLLHLVNNALAHGIETVAERRTTGKPEQGTIALRSAVRGSFVEIEVEDDGRGIDPDALRRRAVELGRWSQREAADRTDVEARALIFERGFSTAERLSDDAGRGIGMDVVRSTLGQLHGEIRIESLPGQGTRFILRVPATLVVSTALRLRVGDEMLLLPTVSVRRVRDSEATPSTHRDGAEWIPIDGEEIQLIRLGDRLGLTSDPRRLGQPLAIVQVPGRTLALAADELIGIEMVVVRELGGFLAGLVGFVGAAFNPDGSLVLVLDPAQLAETAPSRQSSSARVPADRAEGIATRPRVLLVDDSISVRKVLARQLIAAGYEVITAQDGEQALVEMREKPPVALITDLEMPRLNGFELIEMVRRRPATRNLPAIVITTRTGAKHRELADRVGATAYLRKPVDRAALLATLAEVTAPRTAPLRWKNTRDATGLGTEAP